MSAQLELDAAPSLVDLLIEEQQSLSAVDEFAAAYDAMPDAKSRWETLIPTRTPGEREQFAFRIDLDLCSGCKACVTACHSLNGLEEGETWRKVGLLETVDAPTPTAPVHQQTVTTACHHCESPACLAGCPVKAYDKDPITGIVIHLDDQCIGCRYCQLMCPYDVPQYSERLGIVRKCDMCHSRLSAGEAPACVQGCPNEAISIAIVDLDAKTERDFLPAAEGSFPNSSLTRPTTRYVSEHDGQQTLRPVSATSVTPSEAHTPLAIMLPLTQAAIGVIVLDALFAFLPREVAPSALARAVALALATGVGLAGLGASNLHLGRPLYAFRAFLGLRTSWMSREILALGAFSGALVGYAGASWVLWAKASGLIQISVGALAELQPILLGGAWVFGLLGLFCSIRVYSETGRPFWSLSRTSLRFASTAIWLALAIANLAIATSAHFEGAEIPGPVLPMTLIVLTLCKLEWEARRLVRSSDPVEDSILARSRKLLTADLLGTASRRRSLLVASGLALPLLQIGLSIGRPAAWLTAVVAGLTLALGLGAEIIERSLFFRAEATPAMPKGR